MEQNEVERKVREYFKENTSINPNEEGVWAREWIEEDAGSLTSSSEFYQGKGIDLIRYLISHSLNPSDYRIIRVNPIILPETDLAKKIMS